jgi:hypothetical protein
MEQQDVISQLERLPVEQAKLGLEYAEAKASFHNLDEQKKSFLALIKNEIAFEYAPNKVTESQLDRLALGSEKYKQYLVGLSYAEREFLKAEARLNAVNVAIDCVRSINSIKKQEFNLM